MGDKKLVEVQREKVMNTFIAILERDDDSQRRSILLALPDLGSLASRALPALDNIVKGFQPGQAQYGGESVPRPNKLTPRAPPRRSRAATKK